MDLPYADLGPLFPEPPEPSNRVALEHGTIGISEESGKESWNCARHGAPKVVREGLVDEASAPRVKVNMITASLGKAAEANLQTQTGSRQSDPENVTWPPVKLVARGSRYASLSQGHRQVQRD